MANRGKVRARARRAVDLREWMEQKQRAEERKRIARTLWNPKVPTQKKPAKIHALQGPMQAALATLTHGGE